MKKRKFQLWHSLLGTAALLALEAGFLAALGPAPAAYAVLLFFAVVGATANLYIATEAIEEVRNITHMFALLAAVLLEFVVYFAFQYWFLLLIEPASFPTLASDPVSLLLHSTMVFVFNPLYLPTTAAGKLLLLINTLSALGLVLFILQNVWQFRNKTN